MSALKPELAEGPGGAASVGDRAREIARAAVVVKNASGVATRPDDVRPLSTGLHDPISADGAVEAAAAPDRSPGTAPTGGAGAPTKRGGAGPVGRPGSVPPPPEARAGDVAESGELWRDAALCREVDPELFFPVAPRGPRWREQVAEAKAVCARCDVRTQCLEYALEHIPEGVAGGQDEDERRVTRRARVDLGPASRRERGVLLLEAGESREHVAVECRVSVRTVERWITNQRASAAAGASS